MKLLKKINVYVLMYTLGIMILNGCEKDEITIEKDEITIEKDEITTGNGKNKALISVTLRIGSNYQGGIVFYILKPTDPGYDANLTKGLIIYPYELGSVPWYNVRTGEIGTSEEFGTGNANTNAIVSNQGAGNYAARLCYDLVAEGYSDWYLPSFYEFEQIYENRKVIRSSAHLDYTWHWTSSELYGYALPFDISLGVAYGTFDTWYPLLVRAVRSFTASPPPAQLATVSTDYPSSIGITWVAIEGYVLSDGGTTVTSRGFCWSTSSYPTISNNKIIVGSGTGHFASTITGLTTDARYYIRAFATNSAGTAYGNQIVVYTSGNSEL